MHDRIASSVAVAIAFASFGASAQVANGDFSAGYGSWTLRDATYAMNVGVSCANQPYVAANRGTVNGESPAVGRVAVVMPKPSYAPGWWGMCSELEQTVYVPMGKQLKFVARVGEGIYDSAYEIEAGHLSVIVVDGGTSATLMTQRGYNVECLDGKFGQFACPAYRPYTVDVSPYWGKTVRLVFRGASSIRNGQLGGISYPSNVYLDSVRLE